jgi:nicotinamide mononucleotide adenylyltransferase
MDAAFIGRLCPLHAGHEVVIRNMLETAGERSLIVIGSVNTPLSLRHFFSYEERRDFLHAVFPGARIVGVPDFREDREWLLALDDVLSVAGFDPEKTVFFGGCEEDVRFFTEANRQTAILNRFDGSTPKISATEVRDALIHGRSLRGLVNEVLIDRIQSSFAAKWELFKRM